MRSLYILLTILLCLSTAYTLKISSPPLRGRGLNSVSSDVVPCATISSGKCTCPGSCMDPTNSSGPVCTLRKCYTWDDNLATCTNTGPAFIPAIVLQALPFTGPFGAGFGNMGRWDLFGIGSALWGGGTLLACLLACICADSNNDSGRMPGWLHCYALLFSIGLTTYYIWGIVVIANKSILGPDGCPLH